MEGCANLQETEHEKRLNSQALFASSARINPLDFKSHAATDYANPAYVIIISCPVPIVNQKSIFLPDCGSGREREAEL